MSGTRMAAREFALFDTPIGRFGIAWGPRGVAGVQLPEEAEAVTRARMLQRFPAACESDPPADVQRAVDAIGTLLRLLSIEGAEVNGLAVGGGLGFDPRVAVAHVRASDAALARVIDAVGPFRMSLRRTPSLFVALAEAIVYQQLHGRAAATIFARLCALFARGGGRL